jgi:EAL and modified HD-GYP domain-containing signal transduction protein
MKNAITRGRLTELLGEGFLEKNERDNLFIVGIFSMLDAMLCQATALCGGYGSLLS